MKKLMIALVVAAMAVASQAAQMKWASGALKVPETSTALAGTYGASAMFISLTAAQYGALETAVSGKSANEVSKYIYDTYKGTTPTKTGGFMSGAATITEAATYGVGDTAYGVVIYTTYDNKEKTGDLYYIANMGSYKFEADAAATVKNLGTNLNGDTAKAAMSWQVAAVPEPTSAMLLLLGMAGLALRRRRA